MWAVSGSTDSGVMKLSRTTATSRAPYKWRKVDDRSAVSKIHIGGSLACAAGFARQVSRCQVHVVPAALVAILAARRAPAAHPNNLEDVTPRPPHAWLSRSVQHLLNACVSR